ncbi:MAG: thiamine phosphate synthase [Rhizobiaceae bacterium]|nr:MAG: thiamine phosphate synthase [Rhizobiaceae bacterium]CAG1009460.1 thiamine-phosphate pyrophosphorylase [Rhizobiaceae bacterium]
MNAPNPPDRCRLVLIAPENADPAGFATALGAALSGGDVASVILPQYGADEVAFQALAERAVRVAQEHGAAAIVAGDSRVAGRVQADGIHVEGSKADVADAIDRLQGRMIVGAGGGKTRDEALEIGEERPDYVFFGRFGYDRTPEPHSRNLALGRWWAEMIEVPCIVLGGSDMASVEAVAATGAEFVALSAAVFAPGVDPRKAVAEANEILDRTAPRFGE